MQKNMEEPGANEHTLYDYDGNLLYFYLEIFFLYRGLKRVCFSDGNINWL